ncbi:F-box domain-containing protein [Entamoeba marina]
MKCRLNKSIRNITYYLSLEDICLLHQVSKKVHNALLFTTTYPYLPPTSDFHSPLFYYNKSALQIISLLFDIKHLHCPYSLLSHTPTIIKSAFTFALYDVNIRSTNSTLLTSIAPRVSSISASYFSHHFTSLENLDRLVSPPSSELLQTTATQLIIDVDESDMETAKHLADSAFFSFSEKQHNSQTLNKSPSSVNSLPTFRFIDVHTLSDDDVTYFKDRHCRVIIDGYNNVTSPIPIRTRRCCISNRAKGSSLWKVVNFQHSPTLIIGSQTSSPVNIRNYILNTLTSLKQLEINQIQTNNLAVPTSLTSLTLRKCDIKNEKELDVPGLRNLVFEESVINCKIHSTQEMQVDIKKSKWCVGNTSQVIEVDLDDYEANKGVVESLKHLRKVKITGFVSDLSQLQALKEVEIVGQKLGVLEVADNVEIVKLCKCEAECVVGKNIKDLTLEKCVKMQQFEYPLTLTSLQIDDTNTLPPFNSLKLQNLVLRHKSECFVIEKLPPTLTSLHFYASSLLPYALLSPLPLRVLVIRDGDTRLLSLQIPKTLECLVVIGCSELSRIDNLEQSNLKIYIQKLCLALTDVHLPPDCFDASSDMENDLTIPKLLRFRRNCRELLL